MELKRTIKELKSNKDLTDAQVTHAFGLKASDCRKVLSRIIQVVHNGTLLEPDIYRLPELIEKLIGSKGVEYLTPISLSTEGGGYTSVPVGKKSKE